MPEYFSNEEFQAEVEKRKHAEAELREYVDKFNDLAEACADVVLYHDLQGNIAFINEAGLKFTGFTRNEALRANIIDVIPEKYLLPMLERQKRRKAGYEKRNVYEIAYVNKNGASIPLEVNSIMVKDKGVPYILLVVRDLRLYKQKERELSENREKFQNILNSIEDGYYEVDLKGRIVFCNESLCRILGYSKDEVTGKSYRESVDEENGKKLLEAFNNVFKTGGTSKVLDWEVIRKDGSKRFVEASIALVKDPENVPAGFRGLVRDITERKQAEEEHKKFELQMRHAQKMEAIGTLAGGIAHDFNNILMNIQGNVSIMMMEIDPADPFYENLKKIEDSVEKASGLTRQILGFARGGKYVIKEIDLNELVGRTAQLFGRARKEINIQTKFQDNAWSVKADQSQIEQALLNIYLNAWQAMPSGGNLYIVTGNVLIDENYIKKFAITPGRYVMISITDTGVGMDEATKQRVFDPFFTTREIGRGTGLGLASVYGIIKNHDGFINVYSEKGKGSTFNIYLPAFGKVKEEKKKETESRIPGTGTILFVDDEQMIIDVGQAILKKLGYNVIIAKGGQEAVDLYTKNRDKIDLVVLDMIMPDIPGSEVFDRIRELNPTVKVLLSSGYALDVQTSGIMEKGCNGFIQKPFNVKKLSAKLNEILHGQ
ncbi:MAG: PAS domain-containing sensor histidine kinase [Desulfobacteraceae bacterium]|nr:MAG: PAS domain-containing sensor histidine kinase [Desulfobacteraceae bacterium]